LALGRRPLGAILHSSNDEPLELSQWLCHDDSTINIVLVITRHSLVRAKGEVFVLLYVFLVFFLIFVVRSTISRQPAGQFTPKFACECTLVPDVSSSLLGVSGPRRTEEGGNEIFVTIGLNGEF